MKLQCSCTAVSVPHAIAEKEWLVVGAPPSTWLKAASNAQSFESSGA